MAEDINMEKDCFKPSEIVIISPYEQINEDLIKIIKYHEPHASVGVISQMNGVISVGPSGGIGFGKRWRGGNEYKLLYDGLDENDGFYEMNKERLLVVANAWAGEMMYGHDPKLVIDFSQLVGNQGDILGIYEFPGFAIWCQKNDITRLGISTDIRKRLLERMEWDPF